MNYPFDATGVTAALVALLVVSGTVLSVAVAPASAQRMISVDSFGDVTVGGTVGMSLNLFIENPRPDSEITFDSYQVRGPDAAEVRVKHLDRPVTVRGSQVHEFVVEFRPTSPGPKTAELFVSSTGGDLIYPLSGTAYPADGFEPNDDLDSPTSVDRGRPVEAVVVGEDVDVFGFDAVGGQTVTVVVENRGKEPITYFVGAQGRGLLQDPTEVAPGDTATFSVVTPALGTHLVAVGNVYAEGVLSTGERYDFTVPYAVTVHVGEAADGAPPGGGGSEPTVDGATTANAAAGPVDSATTTGSTGSAPGFGVGVAVAVLCAVGFLVARPWE